MDRDAQRHEVEARFRALIAEADLPQPDAVEQEEHSVVFLWHESKLAVFVDLDGPDQAPIDEFERAQILGLPPEQWPVTT